MIERLAERLGLTEGQAYTYAIGIVLSIMAAAGAIPPAFEDNARRVVAAPLRPAPTMSLQTVEPSPMTTTVGPLADLSAPDRPPNTGTPRARLDPGDDTTPAPVDDAVEVVAAGPELGTPEALAVQDDTVFVATNTDGGPSGILAISRSGRVGARRAIAGDGSGTATLTGLAVRRDTLIAVGRTPAAVYELDLAGGAPRRSALVPDVPICIPIVRVDNCETGMFDRAPAPRGIAVDPGGAVYIGDEGQGAIWRMAPGSTQLTLWVSGESFRSLTAVGGPTAVAVDPDGSLVVAVSATGVADEGALVRQAVAADGAPGDRTALAPIPAGALPTGVAVGLDGLIYLTLANQERLVVLTPQGDEGGGIEAPDAPLGRPTGVALDGDDAFVTAPGGGPGGTGALVRIPLAFTRPPA